VQGVQLVYPNGCLTPSVSMDAMRGRVLFLPGASGAGEFWQPVADLLPESFETVLFDWPGLGNVPADARVRSFDDLVDLVLAAIDEPVDIAAQSMGGVVAIRPACSTGGGPQPGAGGHLRRH
jgi:pimeloyl-ACP methyl ester carboxylesterase